MSSIRNRLVVANIERDNMLAAISDEEMYKEATRVGAYSFAVEKWNKRAARRAMERARGLQHSIPPGPWDSDLDNFPPGEYVIDIGDGYNAVLNRDQYWMWRIYVCIPADHPFVGKHYDDLNIRVTYSSGNKFGYYLSESYASSPYFLYTEYNRVEQLTSSHRSYVNYDSALEMAKELKKEFVEAAVEQKHSTSDSRKLTYAEVVRANVISVLRR